MNIILASGSPRRQELLTQANICFESLLPKVDETMRLNETPINYIQRMVEIKSFAAIQELIYQQQNKSLSDGATLLLTADTIGVLADGKTILVKPKNQSDAFAMWQQMSDTTHQVWTSVQLTLIDTHQLPKLLQVALANPEKKISYDTLTHHQAILWQKKLLEKTEVTFVHLTQTDMLTYWQTGEPADKAGGYAIQGKAMAWVERINGSYTNVVGLPLSQTLTAIQEARQYYQRFKLTSL